MAHVDVSLRRPPTSLAPNVPRNASVYICFYEHRGTAAAGGGALLVRSVRRAVPISKHTAVLRYTVSYGVNLPGRVVPSCVAEESRYFLRWPYHIFVSPATYCSSNTNFRRTVQWFPTCLPHAPFSSDARMSSPLFQDSLTQTMHTKLEALGQCIPPPRHVLPVPPSGESV